MRRLLLLFLCCEWISVFRWRLGFGYALSLALVYVLKIFALAQLPLNDLYASFLLITQLVLAIQLFVSFSGTLLRQFSWSSPGATFLNLFGKTKSTLLAVQPGLALLFAALCLAETMDYPYPVHVHLISGEPLTLASPGYYWRPPDNEWFVLPMVFVPFVSAIALYFYNRSLYATTKEAFVEIATKPAPQAPKKPPRGATMAGSAITFPRVSSASVKASAPSLDKIGRSFR